MLGRAMIWPGRAIYVGRLLENDAHAHHAIQISIALEGSLSLQTASSGAWSTYQAVATAPDQLHRIRCQGRIVQIYLDPESEAGLAVRERIGDAGVQSIEVGGAASLGAASRSGSDGGLDEEDVERIIDEVIGTAALGSSGGPIDPRINEALVTMRASTDHRLPLSALADQVALSPSRFGAVFRRETGIPVRRYLLWLRLIDAVEGLSHGENLTQAAHGAGFADSAHLSRTFRRMFGMAPSALQNGHVEIHPFAE